MVTLAGPRGNVVDIEAGDEVRNLDQITVGDKVTVTFYESGWESFDKLSKSMTPCWYALLDPSKPL